MLAIVGIVGENNCEEFMQKRMQHQGGWAATFVVVGVLLLAGLVGGVYFLKTRTTDQVATNDDASSEIERALDEAGSNNDAPSQEQPPKNDTTTSNPDQDKDEPQTQPSPQETAQETKKLPETGPADVFVKLIAVTALTAASVGYLRSR